ncbi:sensor histidine kinase [Guggenheimella bovis]
MKKLQHKIIRSFILHVLFLALVQAVFNDGFNVLIERHLKGWGPTYLYAMLLLNLLLDIGAFTLVALHFYHRIKGYIDEEMKRQMEEEHFLYSSIAHDLKTPMTIIKGYAQALLDEKIPSEKQPEIYRIIRDKTDRSVVLLSDLLTYSKLLKEELKSDDNLELVDLSQTLVQMVADNYDHIEKEGVQLELDVKEELKYPIQPLDFRRICENLLMNAIKHNERGVSIKIGLQKHENEVIFYVADSGKEITDDHIFEAFHTGNEARSPESGHGLGLAIVSKLVKKYGGSVSVEAPYSTYTKAFVVRFPVK